MRAFRDHRRADTQGVSGDLTPLISMTGGQQLGVEIIKIPCVWQRHPMIAPEVAGFALNPAFFVRFPRVAKVTREPPVRAEGDEARGLLAPMALQNLLHRTLQVVVSEQPENAAEIMKRLLVGLKKGLLRRALIGSMEGRATDHAAQREHLQLDLLAAEFRPRLIPIGLAFLSRLIALRHTGRTRRPAQLRFAFAHVLPNRYLRNSLCRQLGHNPPPDAMCRVTLLTRSVTIGLQDRVDKGPQRIDHRPLMFPLPALRRFSIGQRLAHHPPMHSQLARDAEHCPFAELVFPAYLFEQLHLRSPLHPAPPALQQDASGLRGGPF